MTLFQSWKEKLSTKIRFCKKSGRISILDKSLYILFPLLGLLSLVWFLIRVIPKPSRASYPCMKVAAPFASSFIAYMISLFTSIVFFKTARKKFKQSKMLIGMLLMVAAVTTFTFTFISPDDISFAGTAAIAVDPLGPNAPIGEAKGIFPGRVVWSHNPKATNENCDPNSYGHGWFLSENNNQGIIDNMISQVLQGYTEESSDSAAWDAIFRYFNQNHGKPDIGYQSGEMIFIKTNATSAWGGNFSYSDLSVVQNSWYGISETSPHLVLSILRQLVNVVGVDEDDIYIGDPMKHIYKHCYDLWYAEFPDVHYMDNSGFTSLGREVVEDGDSPTIFYADNGTLDGVSDYLYTVLEDADYLINLPTMKGHKHAGMTLFAKNHFGSHTRSGAEHLHVGLVSPSGSGTPTRDGYGLYRVLTDLMGHELLGGNTLLFLVDALWSAGFELDPPAKFQQPPFNNDWTSSVLMSLDPVAVASVCFDILKAETFTEYENYSPFEYDFVEMDGVDDYLHQAADTTTWPENVHYDPEGDGSHLTSLGVHEHWNNPTDKQYTRNLKTGDGIELIMLSDTIVVEIDAPTNLTATPVSESQVDLSWTDNSDNEQGFNIERRSGSGSFTQIASAAVNDVSYSDTELDPAVTYYYRICADSAGNISDYSGEAYATTHFSGSNMKIEAEHMVLDNYLIDDEAGASNGYLILLPETGETTGSAFFVYAGPDTAEDLVINYIDEEDGEATFSLYINSTLISSWTGNQASSSWLYLDRVMEDLTINTGDTIKIVSVLESGERGRVDYLEIEEQPVVNITSNPDIIPHVFNLAQNYPNPFNPVTTIQYRLPEKTQVSIKIYNMLGEKISEPVNDVQDAGSYSIKFDGSNLASGIYLYRIDTANYTKVRKMVLIK